MLDEAIGEISAAMNKGVLDKEYNYTNFHLSLEALILCKSALRAQQERENPKPLKPADAAESGLWGRCQKCNKLNRYEYNYCANCGARICPPKTGGIKK
jgi:hypothetical protein